MKGEKKLFSRLWFQGWDFASRKLSFFNFKFEFSNNTVTASLLLLVQYVDLLGIVCVMCLWQWVMHHSHTFTLRKINRIIKRIDIYYKCNVHSSGGEKAVFETFCIWVGRVLQRFTVGSIHYISMATRVSHCLRCSDFRRPNILDNWGTMS